MTGGTARLVKEATPGGFNNPVRLYVYYSISTDTANNRSTVNCGMYVVAPSGWPIGAWGDYGGSYVGTSALTFDGGIPNFSGTRWLAENKSFTVDHNADGTGSATIAWKWGVRSSWGGFYEPSGSFTVDLPTIPRASQPTVSSNDIRMGNVLTIYTNRASSAFTHTLRCTFGGGTDTIAELVGDSYTWTIPDMAARINNAGSGYAVITCESYNGGTHIGTKACGFAIHTPAATAPEIDSVTIGEKTTVILKPGSANFTHKVSYTVGGYTEVIAADTKQSCAWDVPYMLAGKITAKESVGTVTCETYNGSYRVGTETASITFVVPENDTTKPVFEESGFSITPNGTLPTAFAGLYIQGLTGIRATFTASSTYSSISEYRLSVGGADYTGNPAVSNAVTKPGTIQITGTVTDARGFTRSIKKAISVYSYTAPYLSDLICERSRQDGTYADNGTYLHIYAKLVHSPITVGSTDKNTGGVRYRYKVGNGSWISGGTLPHKGGGVYEATLPNIVSDVTQTYVIQVIAYDTIGSTNPYDQPIPTKHVAFHLKEGGKGAAFGKYAEEDGVLESDFKGKFNNGMDIYGGLSLEGQALLDYLKASLRDYFLPVGFILITESAEFDPNTAYPGTTWERIKDRFILAAGDTYAAGSTGGEATHTLTVDEMPSHEHIERKQMSNGSLGNIVQEYDGSTPDVTDGDYLGIGQIAWYNNKPPVTTTGVGGSQPHNNMPPYIAQYIWKRIS